MIYGTSGLWVLADVQPQTDDDSSAPAPTTFGEHMQPLDINIGIWQMPQGISAPGSSHITVGSEMPQSNTSIPSLQPGVEPDSSPLLKARPVDPVIFYFCNTLKLITKYILDSDKDMVTAPLSTEE